MNDLKKIKTSLDLLALEAEGYPKTAYERDNQAFDLINSYNGERSPLIRFYYDQRRYYGRRKYEPIISAFKKGVFGDV